METRTYSFIRALAEKGQQEYDFDTKKKKTKILFLNLHAEKKTKGIIFWKCVWGGGVNKGYKQKKGSTDK